MALSEEASLKLDCDELLKDVRRIRSQVEVNEASLKHHYTQVSKGEAATALLDEDIREASARMRKASMSQVNNAAQKHLNEGISQALRLGKQIREKLENQAGIGEQRAETHRQRMKSQRVILDNIRDEQRDTEVQLFHSVEQLQDQLAAVKLRDNIWTERVRVRAHEHARDRQVAYDEFRARHQKEEDVLRDETDRLMKYYRDSIAKQAEESAQCEDEIAAGDEEVTRMQRELAIVNADLQKRTADKVSSLNTQLKTLEVADRSVLDETSRLEMVASQLEAKVAIKQQHELPQLQEAERNIASHSRLIQTLQSKLVGARQLVAEVRTLTGKPVAPISDEIRIAEEVYAEEMQRQRSSQEALTIRLHEAATEDSALADRLLDEQQRGHHLEVRLSVLRREVDERRAAMERDQLQHAIVAERLVDHLSK